MRVLVNEVILWPSGGREYTSTNVLNCDIYATGPNTKSALVFYDTRFRAVIKAANDNILGNREVFFSDFMKVTAM